MPTESLTREIFGNIDPISKGVFYALACVAGAICCYGIYRRQRMWNLGRRTQEPIDYIAAGQRLFTQVMLQRKTRRTRVAAGRAHLLIFSGFIVLLIGTLLIAVEHIGSSAFRQASTEPWFHKGVYFAIYELVLDAFGIALIVGCIWFGVRR